MICLRSHPHEPTEACDGSVHHLYIKGVHDERERIIALFTNEEAGFVTWRDVSLDPDEPRWELLNAKLLRTFLESQA